MENISTLTAFGHRQRKSPRFFYKSLLGLLLLSFAFQSCKKQLESPQGNVAVKPTLSASASTIVLVREDTAKTAATFSWTAAKVDGLTGKLTYIIEIDKKGNNFARPIDIKVGGDTLKRAYTVGVLNNLLASLPVNTPTNLELRLVTATSDGSVMPFYSNVISLNVTTFPPVPYSQLWLIGDATPGGWGLSTLTPMTESASDPFIFTYTGPLVTGEFKIATTNDYNAPFYRPTTNHPALSATAVTLSAGDPDNKWQMTSATTGYYKVTLNLHNNTISIVSQPSPNPPYNQLWLIGDATSGGWSLDNATPLVQNAADHFVFTFTGAFTAGEFKIATTKDFNAPFYRPITNDPDLSATTVQLNAGNPDNKWKIPAAGTYKVTLNLHNNTISIVNQAIVTPPYSQLWIIGDATPGGWSLDNATPLVKNATNAFIFTYTGPLVAGEFKIGTAKDFGAPFYRPTTNHPDLSVTTAQVTAGDPDNKWLIGAAVAGNYKITLNTLDNTITIVKQ
ncbi:MAG: SusE outer membrane protein [Mucilaginibacter sp.]|nr:SusE outer membrane protein [Mucilaginibacter sp.]